MKCSHITDGLICSVSGCRCAALCNGGMFYSPLCTSFLPDDIESIPHTAGMSKQASWDDVRAKGDAILANGGVEIYRNDSQEVGAYVMSGVVEGMFPVTDGGPYEVILSKRSWNNSQNVGGWCQGFLCDCVWGSYHSGSPGYGGRWSGRFCSHAWATLKAANMRARGEFFGDRTASVDEGWHITDYDGERVHMREYGNGCVGIIQSRKYWVLLDSVGNVVDEGREVNLGDSKAACDYFASIRIAKKIISDVEFSPFDVKEKTMPKNAYNVDYAAINKMVEFGCDLYNAQFKTWQSLYDIQNDEDVQYYQYGLGMNDEDWQEGCRRIWEEISMTASKKKASGEWEFLPDKAVRKYDGEWVGWAFDDGRWEVFSNEGVPGDEGKAVDIYEAMHECDMAAFDFGAEFDGVAVVFGKKASGWELFESNITQELRYDILDPDEILDMYGAYCDESYRKIDASGMLGVVSHHVGMVDDWWTWDTYAGFYSYGIDCGMCDSKEQGIEMCEKSFASPGFTVGAKRAQVEDEWEFDYPVADCAYKMLSDGVEFEIMKEHGRYEATVTWPDGSSVGSAQTGEEPFTMFDDAEEWCEDMHESQARFAKRASNGDWQKVLDQPNCELWSNQFDNYYAGDVYGDGSWYLYDATGQEVDSGEESNVDDAKAICEESYFVNHDAYLSASRKQVRGADGITEEIAGFDAYIRADYQNVELVLSDGTTVSLDCSPIGKSVYQLTGAAMGYSNLFGAAKDSDEWYELQEAISYAMSGVAEWASMGYPPSDDFDMWASVKGAGRRINYDDDLVIVRNPDGGIDYKGIFDYCPYREDVGNGDFKFDGEVYQCVSHPGYTLEVVAARKNTVAWRDMGDGTWYEDYELGMSGIIVEENGGYSWGAYDDMTEVGSGWVDDIDKAFSEVDAALVRYIDNMPLGFDQYGVPFDTPFEEYMLDSGYPLMAKRAYTNPWGTESVDRQEVIEQLLQNERVEITLDDPDEAPKFDDDEQWAFPYMGLHYHIATKYENWDVYFNCSCIVEEGKGYFQRSTEACDVLIDCKDCGVYESIDLGEEALAAFSNLDSGGYGYWVSDTDGSGYTDALADICEEVQWYDFAAQFIADRINYNSIMNAASRKMAQEQHVEQIGSSGELVVDMDGYTLFDYDCGEVMRFEWDESENLQAEKIIEWYDGEVDEIDVYNAVANAWEWERERYFEWEDEVYATRVGASLKSASEWEWVSIPSGRAGIWRKDYGNGWEANIRENGSFGYQCMLYSGGVLISDWNVDDLEAAKDGCDETAHRKGVFASRIASSGEIECDWVDGDGWYRWNSDDYAYKEVDFENEWYEVSQDGGRFYWCAKCYGDETEGYADTLEDAMRECEQSVIYASRRSANTTSNGLYYDVASETDPNWSGYDKSVAEGQLATYGRIYLDEYGQPIDDEYAADEAADDYEMLMRASCKTASSWVDKNGNGGVYVYVADNGWRAEVVDMRVFGDGWSWEIFDPDGYFINSDYEETKEDAMWWGEALANGQGIAASDNVEINFASRKTAVRSYYDAPYKDGRIYIVKSTWSMPDDERFYAFWEDGSSVYGKEWCFDIRKWREPDMRNHKLFGSPEEVIENLEQNGVIDGGAFSQNEQSVFASRKTAGSHCIVYEVANGDVNMDSVPVEDAVYTSVQAHDGWYVVKIDDGWGFREFGPYATYGEAVSFCDENGYAIATAGKVAYNYASFDADSKWRCHEEGFEGEYGLDELKELYESVVDKSEYPEFEDWEWDATRSGWLYRVGASSRGLGWDSTDDYVQQQYDEYYAGWESEGKQKYAPWHYGQCPRCGVSMNISDEYGICYQCAKDEWVDDCRYCKKPLNGGGIDGYCSEECRDKQLAPYTAGKNASCKVATRQFTYAEMQELEDEINGTELHNADRFKDGGAEYYGEI